MPFCWVVFVYNLDTIQKKETHKDEGSKVWRHPLVCTGAGLKPRVVVYRRCHLL